MPKKIEFDTTRIDALIDEIDAALHRVTSTPVEADPQGKARHNDPAKARISRDLLRTADLVSTLESEVRSLYWTLKGYDDPTREG